LEAVVLTPEDWYILLSGGVMLLSFLSILLFGRATMAPMEKKIEQDGLPRPCPWDGPGVRILWYAYAIALPVGRLNRADDPLIDVPLVRRYATKGDKARAVMLLASTHTFILTLFFYWLLIL
jgi:hypothetical protein